MNRKLSASLSFTGVAAAAVVAASVIVPRTAAAAGDISIDTTPFISTATRAEVRAGLVGDAQFLRDTEWVLQRNHGPVFKSALTRVELRNEYKSSRGLVSAITSEDSGSSYFKRHPLPASSTAVMGAPAAAMTPEAEAPSTEIVRMAD